MLRVMLLFLSVVFVTSCGITTTVSVGPYTPQNASKLNCSIEVDNFLYQPFEDYKAQTDVQVNSFARYGGLSSPNRVLSTDASEVYLTVPVASYVQIGTALELERSGVKMDRNPTYVLNATINEFKADILAKTVTWNYSITYTVTNKRSGNVVATTTFTELKYKTGKSRAKEAPYTEVIDYLIYSGYMKLLSDMKANNVCGSNPEPAKKATTKRKR